jgi:hypothetical protein
MYRKCSQCLLPILYFNTSVSFRFGGRPINSRNRDCTDPNPWRGLRGGIGGAACLGVENLYVGLAIGKARSTEMPVLRLCLACVVRWQPKGKACGHCDQLPSDDFRFGGASHACFQFPDSADGGILRTG